MDALMQQGQALAYSLRAIDAQFQRTFPGAQAFRIGPYLDEQERFVLDARAALASEPAPREGVPRLAPSQSG